MKRFALVALSMALALQVSGLDAKATKTKKVNFQKTNCTNSCKGKFYLTNDDFKYSGFRITQPGEWILAEDIRFSASADCAAITIAASNVTLNLNQKTLSMHYTDQNLSGVCIQDGAGNVTIKDGTISNFSRAGILKERAETSFGSPDCRCPKTGLIIKNVRAICNGTQNVSNAGVDGMGGAVIFDARDVQITDSSFLDNAFSGAFIEDSTKISIDNCHFDDNISSFLFTTPYTAGAYLNNIKNLHIKNSTFNSNSAELEAHGLRVQGENIIIEAVEANETSVSIDNPLFSQSINSGNVSGMFILDSQYITIKNSQVFGYLLTASQCPLINLAFGISLSNCTSYNVQECEIGNGVSTNTSSTATQFFTQSLHQLFSRRGVVESCEFYDNTNVSPVNGSLLRAVGCGVEDSEDIEIKSCTAINSNQTAPTPPVGLVSQASGFQIIRDSFRIFLTDCTAFLNNGLGTSDAYGFSTLDAAPNAAPSINILFDDCKAELNRADAASAGFIVHRVSLCEIVDSTSNDNAIGIWLTDASTVNNIIHKNTITNNYVYGIRDESLSLSTSYNSNYAKNNGPSPATTNYSDSSGLNTIFPDATCLLACVSEDLTPIRYWQLPLAPCPLNTNCLSGDNLDNISIING